jgi:hypothetical protein
MWRAEELAGRLVRAKGASRGGAGGGRTPCAMCGGGEAAWESNPVAVELAGVQNRGGGAAARRGERERCQRGWEWDQEKPERLGGASIGGRGRPMGGENRSGGGLGSGKAGGRG